MAIPDVLKVIADLQQIVIDILDMIKAQQYFKALDLLKEVFALFKDLKAAFPELKSMNADDAKTLLQAIIAAVEAVAGSVI